MTELFFNHDIPLTQEEYLRVAPIEQVVLDIPISSLVKWDIYKICEKKFQVDFETLTKKYEEIDTYLIYSEGNEKAIEPITGRLFIPVFRCINNYRIKEVVGFMPSMKEGHHERIN